MSMRCLLVQPIHKAGRLRLERESIAVENTSSTAMSDVEANIDRYDAVITRDAGLSASAIAAGTRLRVIVSHGTGVDSIAVDEATKRGILVVNTPGTNARSVAELAVCLALAAARRVPAADQAVRKGDQSFRERHRFIELAGRTALIVGWGAVGRATAAILRNGLGLTILVYSSHADADEIEAHVGQKVDSLAEGLALADMVSLHTTMRAETENLLDEDSFNSMKPGSILINTARAGLIDERALINALDSGRVAAAGLDVFEPNSALIGRPEVILTPHLGGSTVDSLKRTALAAAESVIEALRGGIPTTTLNGDKALQARKTKS